MANFFTSYKDLGAWVQGKSNADAATKILLKATNNGDEQNIVETCLAIHEKADEGAEEALFKVLSKYNLTELKENREVITMSKEKNNKMKKEAQTMRSGLYNNMPLRVCPKLPYSSGKRLISTWNCREHCLDSLVLDDDPGRVYCLETLWRRHIADKFSREFKDSSGNWVGGYINDRFHRLPDAGTPANPNVDRMQGNQMELAHGERTRDPRPHQWSTEARLNDARGTDPSFHTAKTNSPKFVKLASVEPLAKKEDDKMLELFNDIVDMKGAGFSDSDIIEKCAEHYDMDIVAVGRIHKSATTLLKRHDNTIYSCDNSGALKKKLNKSASLKKESIGYGDDFNPITLPRGTLPINITYTDPNMHGKTDVLNSTVADIQLVQADPNTDTYAVVQNGTTGPIFAINDESRYEFDSHVILSQGDVEQAFEDVGLFDNSAQEEQVKELYSDSPDLATDIARELSDTIGPMNVPG